MNFSNNLSILRRRAGYTQEGLAEVLGVSRQAVSKWESGLTLPEAATLLTLADLLSCTLDQLMRETLDEDPPSVEVLEEPTLDEVEEERYALFITYNKHMDRLAVIMGGGVFLILLGVGLLIAGIALQHLYWAGLAMMGAFPLCLIVAVCFISYGGITDNEFHNAHPVLPEFYSPDALARFQHTYQLGMTGAIAAILVDIVLLGVLMFIFETHETLAMLSVALFLAVLGFAVGAITLLGVLHDKYDLEHYAQHAERAAR